jgi:uncharacterized protein (DUF1778 family)
MDKKMNKAQPAARLEARISHDLHGLLRQAAELEGRSVTDFVVAAVQQAASDALAKAHYIQLAQADQMQFAKSLLAPAKPKAALTRAFENRRKLLDLT